MVEITREADPLPRKVGEIGYTPSQTSLATFDQSTRDNTPPFASTASLNNTSSTGRASGTTTPAPSSTSSMPKKSRCFLWRWRSHDAPPLVFGLRACSLLRFIIIFCIVGGTIAGWALAVSHLNAASNSQSSNDSNNDNDNNNDESVIQMTGAMYIFVHVAFAIAVLLELVFLERALFQLRAERWAYLHPGETLPRHSGRGNNTLGYAPWSRPSLPTYAAALGFRGTGDVEDDQIAQPPPPAYGNTRGSTLLLSTALRNSLRRFTARSTLTEVPESRPVSYVSRVSDNEDEVMSDAERARQLEAALARLEEGSQPATRLST